MALIASLWQGARSLCIEKLQPIDMCPQPSMGPDRNAIKEGAMCMGNFHWIDWPTCQVQCLVVFLCIP